jgi:bifunctional DNA primase/polymerase-like protein
VSEDENPAAGPDDPAGETDFIPPEPFTAWARAFDSFGGYEHADDYGEISALTLTEGEENYRSRAAEIALHYARDYGLEVFPVWWMADSRACACRDGESCMTRGKHPVDLRWPEVATSDPERAARWWRKLEPEETLPIDWRPKANVGVRTGEKHFITDIDTDGSKPGEESLARLAEQHAEAMPETLAYQTGGGGRQYVLLVPDGTEVRNSASALAAGIDVRGYNGYGILPPSVSGKGEYLMLADRSPDVPAPGWEAD